MISKWFKSYFLNSFYLGEIQFHQVTFHFTKMILISPRVFPFHQESFDFTKSLAHLVKKISPRFSPRWVDPFFESRVQWIQFIQLCNLWYGFLMLLNDIDDNVCWWKTFTSINPQDSVDVLEKNVAEILFSLIQLH